MHYYILVPPVPATGMAPAPGTVQVWVWYGYYVMHVQQVASSPEELQKMLDIVYAYSNNWRYRLNASKIQNHDFWGS